jgi:iron complex transport system substrate-binding protein
MKKEMKNEVKKTSSMRVIALLMALIMAVGMLAGCGSSSGGASPSAAPESKSAASAGVVSPSEAPQNTSAASAADTVTVTDMAGRTVKLPKEINSIATFGSIGVINAFVELMGCGDKICNDMTANFTQTDKWAMQYKFAPQIKGAPVLQNADGEIQMEKVLALHPDLCLVMSKDLIEPLESKGLNVVFFDWKQTDDIKTAVTLLGKALGKEDISKDYLAYFDNMIAEAKKKTSSMTTGKKKTVLYGDIDKLTQPHIIAEWWIDAAGGISVTADSWKNASINCTYTQEDVLKWTPDVMITTGAPMKDTIKANSLYSDIPAVKNDAIYCIPTVAHVWGNRTVEQPLTVFWTMNKLYPDLESTKDLKDKIGYFYSHFYKYDMSDAQISAIIGK